MIFSKFKSKSKYQITVKELLNNRIEHEWICQDKSLSRFFTEALSLLSKEDFSIINNNKELCFLYSSGRYASTLSTLHDDKQFIILYPDLISMIKTVDNTIAFAILYHELGHIYFKHDKSQLSPLEKQFEADAFACKYGFDQELLDILKGVNQSYEVIQRVKRIWDYQHNHLNTIKDYSRERL